MPALQLIACGCQDDSDTTGYSEYQARSYDMYPAMRSLDVLVIIDVSPSASQALQWIPEGVAGLVSSILGISYSPGCSRARSQYGDARFAFATSDLGAGGVGFWGCDASPDAGTPHLLTTPDSDPPDLDCQDEYPPYLEWSALPRDPLRSEMIDEVSQAARCLAHQAPGSCGIRQPLETILRLLEEGGEARTSGFLRDGSDLLIVLMTTGDDCSIDDPSFFENPPAEAESAAMRCTSCRDSLLDIVEFHDRLLEAAGPRLMMLQASTGVPPYDVSCNRDVSIQRIDSCGDTSYFDEEACTSGEAMLVATTGCDDAMVDGVCSACSGHGVDAAPSPRIVGTMNRFACFDLASVCDGPSSLLQWSEGWDIYCCPPVARTTGLMLSCEGGECVCSSPCTMHEFLQEDGPCLAPGSPMLDDGGDPVIWTDSTGTARPICILPRAKLATDSDGGCSLPSRVDLYMGVSTTGESRFQSPGWTLVGDDSACGTEPDVPVFSIDDRPIYEIPFDYIGISPNWGSLIRLTCTASTGPERP